MGHNAHRTVSVVPATVTDKCASKAAAPTMNAKAMHGAHLQAGAQSVCLLHSLAALPAKHQRPAIQGLPVLRENAYPPARMDVRQRPSVSETSAIHAADSAKIVVLVDFVITSMETMRTVSMQVKPMTVNRAPPLQSVGPACAQMVNAEHGAKTVDPMSDVGIRA